jgi:hypothetical protein
MKKLFGSSRGQIMVVYTIALVALLGAIALCTDVAVMYVNWQQLQKAADAAALAGAGYLPDQPSAAASTAQTYVGNNGSKTGELTGGTPAVSPNQLSVTVSLGRTVPYYFAQVLGMTNQSINVTATAGIKTNGSGTRGLIPLGLSCPDGATSGNCVDNKGNPDYIVGTTYNMKQDQSQTSLSGNWGALSLGANGASQYQLNLELGYNGPTEDAYATKPGNVVGPTQTGISERVTAGVGADPSIAANVAPCSSPSSCATAMPSLQYDPRLVVVPLIDYSGGKGGKNGNGNKAGTGLPVVGYALMWLLGTSGNNATVNAVYLGSTPTPATGGSSVADFGTQSPILEN